MNLMSESNRLRGLTYRKHLARMRRDDAQCPILHPPGEMDNIWAHVAKVRDRVIKKLKRKISEELYSG